MQTVTRAERLLNKLAANPQVALSQTGKDWLVAIVDPFHDTQLKNLAGWPDLETAHSVVRCVTQNATIARPSGFAANTWDCHIAVMPILNPATWFKTTSRANNAGSFTSAQLYAANMGGVRINPVDQTGGVAANWWNTAGIGNETCITLPANYQEGVGRLIAMGYEVYDTTAQIYQQGSITCYRQNEAPRDPCTFVMLDTSANATTVSTNIFTGTLLRSPPTTLAQATLLPGNRTWAAKDGLYQVMSFHSNENTPFDGDYNVPVFHDINTSELVGSSNTGALVFPIGASSTTKATTNVTFTDNNSPTSHIHPIHQSGCILSGLNNNSTFTITVKFYYETFPSIQESDILVLATPSAQYDPMALEIYSRSMASLPVGVPVKENGLGSWFADCIESIARWADPIWNGIKQGAANEKAMTSIGANNAASQVMIGKKKKKRVTAKNNSLAVGSRGKKGNIQGPLPKPPKKRKVRGAGG